MPPVEKVFYLKKRLFSEFLIDQIKEVKNPEVEPPILQIECNWTAREIYTQPQPEIKVEKSEQDEEYEEYLEYNQFPNEELSS